MSDAVFDIRLTRKQDEPTGSTLSVENYSDDLDSVVSIHADICEAIQQVGAAEFIVSGFGEDRWPVDVHTDLLTILEQLPEAVAALSENRQFLVDFYEQGMERTLTFSPQGDTWRVNCTSRTSWRPNPEECEVPHNRLVKLLHELVCEFGAIARSVCPQLVSHEWYATWARSVNAMSS